MPSIAGACSCSPTSRSSPSPRACWSTRCYPGIWFLFVAEALGTAAYSFQRPARNALTPRLVREDQLLAAIAVEDVVFTLARVIGPALAGVLIAVFGLPGAYGIDVATFATSLLAIWLLPRIPAAPDADRPSLQ